MLSPFTAQLEVGRLAATRAIGPLSKTEYDRLGRIVASYTIFDDDETSYADALTVSGDPVIGQTIRVHARSSLTTPRKRGNFRADARE